MTDRELNPTSKREIPAFGKYFMHSSITVKKMPRINITPFKTTIFMLNTFSPLANVLHKSVAFNLSTLQLTVFGRVRAKGSTMTREYWMVKKT